MTILIKDNSGKIVLEKEINKEEVLLKVSVKDEECFGGNKEYSLEQVCGSYH